MLIPCVWWASSSSHNGNAGELCRRQHSGSYSGLYWKSFHVVVSFSRFRFSREAHLIDFIILFSILYFSVFLSIFVSLNLHHLALKFLKFLDSLYNYRLSKTSITWATQLMTSSQRCSESAKWRIRLLQLEFNFFVGTQLFFLKIKWTS